MHIITSVVVVTVILLFIIKKYKRKYVLKSKIYKALVIVKVSNPTKAQIKRYYEWKKTMSLDYRFEILSDKNLTIPKMKVNVISPHLLFKKWPNILKLGGVCYNKGVSKAMWVSIVEHYILYAILSKIRFKYFWMIEQDLGYSGNLYKFMKQYENSNVDVILKEWYKHDTSFWSECFTPEYYNWRIKYHYNIKYQSYNWITRLSNNAVDKLYIEFELGRHVDNEESLPERIKPLNLTYIFFNHSYDGYKYDWNTRINSAEWYKILNNKNYTNKLFHALKF